MAFDFSKGTTVIPTAPTSGPATLGGGFDFSKGQVVTSGAPTKVPDAVHKNFLSTIGNALTSSEQTLGKGLSTVFDKTSQQTVTDVGQQGQQDQQSIIDAIHKQSDPTKRQHLVDFLKQHFGVDYKVPTAGDLNPGFNLSTKQVVGAAAGTLLDTASFGSYGKAATAAENTGKLVTKSAALNGLLSKVGISSVLAPTEQVVKSAVKPALTESLKMIGKKTATNATKGAGIGYAYDVTQKMQQDKSAAEILKPGAGTWTGAALPVAIGALEAGVALTKDLAPRMINSLVKPKVANFAYGKNPGRTVSEMGITGNNLEDFGKNISTAKQGVGSQIGDIISNPANADLQINAQDEIKKIDAAIAEAAKGGKNNQQIVTTLQNVKDALLYEHTVNVDGQVVKAHAAPINLSKLNPEQAFQLKQDIASMTRFTGNPSDDKAVNATLKSLYGGLADKINGAVGVNNPEIEKLNQQYADLTSAELAIRNRSSIVQRSNMVSLPAIEAGGAAAVVSAILSGGATIPVIVAGAGGAALEKALASTAVKTRVAAWLGSESPAIIQKLSPEIKTVLLKVLPKFAAQINQKPKN